MDLQGTGAGRTGSVRRKADFVWTGTQRMIGICSVIDCTLCEMTFYQGEEGVSLVLKILCDELRRAMALTGCARLSDINPNYIVASSLSALSKL